MEQEKTRKNHFIQQLYLKKTFQSDIYPVLILKNSKELRYYNPDKLILLPTKEIFNSNFLLDNKTDGYWSVIENNLFLKEIIPLLNSRNFDIFRQRIFFEYDFLKDFISYILKLAIRTPYIYWNICQEIVNNNLPLSELKNKINQALTEKHILHLNLWLNSLRALNSNNLNVSFINFKEPIEFLGEAGAIYLDLYPSIKKEIINHLVMRISTDSLSNHYLYSEINKILSFSIILPVKKGFICIINNYNNYKINPDLTKLCLDLFFNDKLYFQFILNTSLEQIVITNKELFKKTSSIDKEHKWIDFQLSKSDKVLAAYNDYSRYLKKEKKE